MGVTFVGFRFRSAIGRRSRELVVRVLRAYLLSFHTHCLSSGGGFKPQSLVCVSSKLSYVHFEY
ncbi:hypothetical protein GZOEXZXM_CDS0223 [Salmonella phage SeKF_64]